MVSRRSLGASASLLAALALAACGGGDGRTGSVRAGGPITSNPDNEGTRVEVGAIDRSDQRLLASIDAEALRAAGFQAIVKNVRSTGGALAALKAGRIGVYPDFADTLLATLRVPSSPPTLARLRARIAAREAVVVPGSAGARSPAVVVTAPTARRLHLKRVSDLRRRASKLTLAGPRGCSRRRDCLPALRRAYGFRFHRFVSVRRDVVHEPLRTGHAAAAIVASTDPRIARGGELMLADDRHAFRGAPVAVAIGRQLAHEGGDSLLEALEAAGSALTAPVMQELNARVEFDAIPPGRVARYYLRTTGIVR